MWKITTLLTIALACVARADDAPDALEADVFDAVVFNKTVDKLDRINEESLWLGAELTPYEVKLLSEVVNSLEDAFDHGASKVVGCECSGKKCNCCLKVNVKLLPKVEACAVLEYLSKDEGFKIQLVWNDNALLSKTISTTNAPSQCVGIPKFKKVKVCLELSDITLEESRFSVTITCKVKLGFVKIASFKLGTVKHIFRAPTAPRNETQLDDQIDSLSKRLALSPIPADDEVDWVTFNELYSVAQQLIPAFEKTEETGCKCVKPKCSCCLHIGALNLNADVCLSVEYLVSDIGIAVQLTWNGKKLVGQTVSARNPPSICVGVPGLGKALGVCFGFNDIRVSGGHFHTCPYFKVKVAFVSVFKQNLPCIDI